MLTSSFATSLPTVWGINPSFFDPPVLLQLLTNGLANGAIFALMALTVVMIYRTTGHLNFAQGEMATMGAFVVAALSVTGDVPYWVSIPLVLLISIVVGAALHRTVVARVEDRGGLTVVLVTLGLFLIFNSLTGAIWGQNPVESPSPFPNAADARFVLMDGPPQFAIRYSTIGIWVTLALVVVGLWWMLSRTRLGLSYRAVAANPESAGLVGIPRERMLMFGWGLAAALGSLAGVLFAQKVGTLDFHLMASVLLYGFAAAALGGFDSISGAVIAGLIVGLVEAIVPSLFTFIGSELGLVISMFIIVAVLLLRPQGLFGTKRVERV